MGLAGRIMNHCTVWFIFTFTRLLCSVCCAAAKWMQIAAMHWCALHDPCACLDLELRMWVTDDHQEYAETDVVCVSFRGTVEIQEWLVLLVHQAWRWVGGYLCVDHFNTIWTVIKTLRQHCGYFLLHLLNFSNHVILMEEHEMLQWPNWFVNALHLYFK